MRNSVATIAREIPLTETTHAWLRPVHVAFVAGPSTPLAAQVAASIMQHLAPWGHEAQPQPTQDTDVLLTTARFGEPLQWRSAPFFQARRQYRLARAPTVFTVVQVRPAELAALHERLARALAKPAPVRADFDFPGLAPHAHETLFEQGSRGGPILAIERMMQSQALCLRVIAVVGDDRPDYAFHFDLVGSYARTDGSAADFYDDIVMRMATVVSAEDVGKPVVLAPEIPAPTWAGLTTPPAMLRASAAFGRRNFFTKMVRIADLIHVPALEGAIASQYSEGCFATWEPQLDGLLTTVTGSAHPVDKAHITDDDLAVVTGVQPDGKGPLVRQVEGLRNAPPSTEGFEMYDMDAVLPTVGWRQADDTVARVPVARSKLHSHRGVAAYDPARVEYVPMAPAYFRYPVTCGTLAQAHGLKATFARSAALQNPADSRQVVFTILPTHGVFIVEKWVPGKAPFEIIGEYMDAGWLQIDRLVPQGPDTYHPATLD